MKHFFSTILALVILTESLLPKGAGISQDFKFGEMISHYQEHKDTAKKAFDFIDFLQMHYAADSSHKRQNHHDNIPCLDGHNLITIFQLPTQSIRFLSNSITVFFETGIRLAYANTYHFLFAIDLLNPPQ